MNSTTSVSGSGGVSTDATSCVNMTTNVVTTESSVLQASSTTAVAPIPKMNYLSPTPPSPNVPIKRVIRKITPIDPKKLQQLGFNREIAAAINKQKKSTQLAATGSKPTQMVSNIKQHITTASSSITTGTSSTITAVASPKIILAPPVVNTQQQKPQKSHSSTTVKSPGTPKTIIPPKITITGPESPTEMELKKLEGLNSQQRLMHVKNLLNKKLLQKKTTTTNDANVKFYKRLKPPTETTALQVQNNVQIHRKELLTVADKVVTQPKGFIKLKDPDDVATPAKVIKLAKTKTPLKSPKDIARKIDFQSEVETQKIVPQPQRSYKKSLNSEMCTIPKASLQNSNNQEQISKPINYVAVNKEAEHYEKQKIDFPEMSPLKIHFPSSNVPQETPLPAIDSFKKPYTLSNSAFYSAQTDFVPPNYGTPAILPHSTLIGDGFNTSFSAASTTGYGNGSASNSTNCLIVLENKVLSQDEMIDLTELRLSTSKVGTPRFATPHKPIPEVVIKQEKSDEYSTSSPPLPAEEATQTNIAKETKAVNNKPSTNRVVISTKQNKKIIINAHKLKLPPDQLANLAKQIAQSTGVAKPNATIPVEQKKQPNITAFGSKGDINNSLINTSHTRNYGNFTLNSLDCGNTSLVNSVASNNNMQLHADPYQNDHNYLPFPKQYSCKRIVNTTPTACNQTTEPVEKPPSKETKEHELETPERRENNQFVVIVKEEPKSNDGFSNITTNCFDQSSFINSTNATNTIDEQSRLNRSSVCYRKSAVEIVDEPAQMEDCFSAVDFIASLNETNPITEETSLELSPEELNLNASFAMNLSPLRIETQHRNSKKQLFPEHIVKDSSLLSSTNIGNIINVPEDSITTLNPQQLSTIVIESSNGPETILTSDNNDVIMDNTLQTESNATKTVSNTNSLHLEIEKPKNVAQYNDKAQNKPMNFAENSININEPSQISLESLPLNNLNLSISNEVPTEDNTTNTSAIETTSVEGTVEYVNMKPSTQVELIKDVSEISSTEPSSVLVHSSKGFKELSRAETNKSLIVLNNNRELQTLKEPSPPPEVTLELEKTKSTCLIPSAYITCKQVSEPTKMIKDEIASMPSSNKCAQVSETSKTNDNTTLNASSIPAKRISRFKKGKINLVQRNKAGAIINKTIGLKANDVKSNKESQPTISAENLSEISVTNEPKDISMENHDESPNMTKELSKSESQSNPTANTNESKRDDAILESVENYSKDTVNLAQHQENEKIIDVNVETQINQTIQQKDTSMRLPKENSKHAEVNILESGSMSTSIKELENDSLRQVANCQTKTNKETEETTSPFIKPNATSTQKEDREIPKHLLEDVRQPKVSLIDIVKYSPPILSGKPPVIPFKKTSSETCQKTDDRQPKGIQNLLQQLKAKENDNQKESEESSKETNQQPTKSSTPIQQTQHIANMCTSDEHCTPLETNSIHDGDNSEESFATSTAKETTILTSIVDNSNKNSTKQLTSYDDLEFLPVNAEIEQYKAGKPCENIKTPSKDSKEKSKCLPDTPLIKTRSAAYLGISPLSNVATRRTRLYSKPLDIELSTLASPTVKRTRFYSQSQTQYSETDNTLKPLFDVTKNNADVDVIPKPLIIEESCQFSSSHDEKITSAKRQRKKLRKTLEDIKKSQNSYSNTDSEDDDTHHFDCANDCGETNEFLGFEEDNLIKTTLNVSNKHNVENISLAKTKGGTLKNWLTTGKAISPTLNKVEAHNDPTSSPVKRTGGPLKKRLDFSASVNEETDITDDTSPADDEEEEIKNISNSKRPKRGLQNVIESDTNLLASKRIKLAEQPSDKQLEHKFIEPQKFYTKSKNSCTDAECNNENVTKRVHTRLSSNSSPKIEINRRKHLSPITKASHSETDSDCHEERISRRLKSKDKAAEKNDDDNSSPKIEIDRRKLLSPITKASHSETDSDCHEERISRRLKSKDKTAEKNKPINTDSDMEKQSGIDSDLNEVKSSRRHRSKEIVTKTNAEAGLKRSTTDSNKTNPLRISSSSTEPLKADDTVTENCKGNKNKEVLDKSVKSTNSDHDNNCLKSKKSKKSRKKPYTDNTKNEKSPLDIPQTHETQTQDSTTTRNDELNNIMEAEPANKFIEDNKDNDAQNSSPFLDKKSRKKKNSSLEAEASTPASKKSKHSRVQSESPKPNVVSFTPLEKSANESESSSLLKKSKKGVTAQQTPTLVSKKADISKEPNESPNESIALLEVNSNNTETSLLSIPLAAEQSHLNKKSRLKSKSKLIIQDPVSNDNTETAVKEVKEINQKDTPKTGTRGKKRNPACNFNPRLLLITKREQYETDEILTVNEPGKGTTQCGLCLERMHPSKWTSHLAQHYGIGWKVGEEKMNIESRYAILLGMNVYIKETAPEGLNCRMCNKTYRSGAGLLMHIETCGMQQVRVNCEYCKRDYAQSSLLIHMRSCHMRYKVESKDQAPEQNEEVFGNTGRIKRHSTIKAENKLKVIEKELELGDKKKTELEPKDRIRYVPPLLANDFKKKWSADIKKCGKGSCPKKMCKYTSTDLKELTNHLSSCKYIKTGYVCRPCRKRIFKTEKEAIEHVIKTHQNANESDYEAKTDAEATSEEYDNSMDGTDVSADEALTEDDELEDDEGAQKPRKNKKSYNRTVNPANASTFQRKRVFDGRYTDLNGEVLKKWKNFLKLNHASETLFAEFHTDFSVKDRNNYLKYLPSNVKSMKFNIATKSTLTPSLGEPESNIEWSVLNRFESINNKMDTFFYLGAPIKFCCWLPLPDNVEEQYLLVSYRRDKFTKFLNPKHHKNVLLILKVVQNNRITKLRIEYGFIVNDGPVHNVAFLPSGGYDSNKNRLGLVAIATIKSSMKVYALPINVENSNTTAMEDDISDNNIVFIDVKPSFALILDMQKNEQMDQHILLNTQCLQICWSEFSGHKHIFASFSNGFIGIWDITNDSEDNLNRYVEEDLVNFLPINYFYLGEKSVKSIALHYDTNGPRWLAATGLSRKFVIYDIKYLTQPMVMKDDCAKNIILSVDWCQLWETILYSYCDAMPNNGRSVLAVNPTNVMFTTNKLDLMAAGVTQIHYSPVTNMCAASVENGDLIFLNPKELHYEVPLGKPFYERRILCAMDIKQLNGEPLTELRKVIAKNIDEKVMCNWKMYEERENYGLIFKPFLKLKDSLKKTYLDEKRCPALNFIPFLRINALRYNLNLNAKNLVAVGYENGFLRIVYFNRDSHIDN